MKNGLIALLSLVLVAVLTGCTDTTEPEPMEEEGTTIEAPAEEPMVEEEPMEEAVEEAIEEAPAEEAPVEVAPVEEAPAEAPMEEEAAATDDLTGTQWVYNDIQMEFREGNKVFLKEGALASVAPDGHEATYTLTDGVIEVDVLGQTYTGTWDGSALVIDGTPAEKVE